MFDLLDMYVMFSVKLGVFIVMTAGWIFLVVWVFSVVRRLWREGSLNWLRKRF